MWEEEHMEKIRCISLVDEVEYYDGEFLGVDESGVPMHDVVVVPVGTYCSYTEEKNPDCSKCRAFIAQ